MTTIEKIKAKIERLKKAQEVSEDKDYAQYELDVACGYNMACDDILSFLSTLESEKSMNQEAAVKYKNSVINSLRKKRVFPALKGEQLHKFKNEVNTLKQILQPWQTYGNIQSELFEQFALAFAVWGGYNLSFRVQDSELEDSRDLQNKEGSDSSETPNDLNESEKPMEQEKEIELCHRTRKRLAEWSKTQKGRESYEKVAEEMRKQIIKNLSCKNKLKR